MRVCARRVCVQRPKGVGWGAAVPHEAGTYTRNEYRKSMLKSRCWMQGSNWFYSRGKTGKRIVWHQMLTAAAANQIKSKRSGPVHSMLSVAQLKPD